MLTLPTLLAYLDDLLQPKLVQDYCPNGLQVQGRKEIKKLITGVTACQALLDAAIAKKADAILVHHGYFWRGEDARVVGMKQRRLRSLLLNDISLLAYHLPLDIHAEYGNNAQLGKILAISLEKTFAAGQVPGLIFVGRFSSPLSATEFTQRLRLRLGREPLHISASDKPIATIAWCTGGAQNFIEQVIDYGVDAYLTGEVSEQTVHIARENQLHFFAAGHHATERYGVKAVGEHLADHFKIDHEFIDIENPV
ncbi:Nif3-like dinuclear metal center hexameric protein [soil metagenome]